jgi:HlyD family secretion protein
MKRPSPRLLAGAALGVVALGAAVWFGLRPARGEALVLYGNVEVREVPVSFRQGGRIARILVEEGAQVAEGQLLAQLDTATLEDALASADADVGVAQAEAARIAAPSRAQEIASAAASVRQAQAALSQNAGLLDQNAAALAQAAAQVQQAGAAARQQAENLDQLDAVLSNLETDCARQQSLVPSGSVSERTRDAVCAQRDGARAQRDAAVAQRDAADAAVRSALAAREAVAAQRAQTLGAREGLAAGLDSSRQTLSLRQEGPRATDVASGAARVEQAQAARRRAQTALADSQLVAPSAGVVIARSQEPGALVQAGTPVVSLSLGAPVHVRAYVGETDLGRVAPGTRVEVISDSSTDVWQSTVGFAAPRAEFTPKSVETEDLRTDLVYRIRVVVPGDPAGATARLLPGMPVTIRLAAPTRSGTRP